MIEKLTEKRIDFLASTKEQFLDAWNKTQLIEGIEKGGLKGYVFLQEDKPIGYITFSTVIDSSDIECVFTHPDYRGIGVASSLFEETFSELERIGIKKIFLEVRKSNRVAKKLYEKLGFKEISQRKNYYDGKEDAMVFLKEI